MEKGINAAILNQFGIAPKDLRTYSPLALAYIGDGIYDLIIRSLVMGEGNASANRLHRQTSRLVKAETQAKLIELLRSELSEEEEAVYRRGRNAKSPTMAKHATMSEYRRATGFEALMGYLYLKDDFFRILELVKLGLARLKETPDWPMAKKQPAAEHEPKGKKQPKASGNEPQIVQQAQVAENEPQIVQQPEVAENEPQIGQQAEAKDSIQHN